MEKQLTKIKSRKMRARRVTSLALAFVLLWVSYGFYYSDGRASAADATDNVKIQGNSVFYKWTRVEDEKQLKELINASNSDKNSNTYHTDTKNKDWFRIMLIMGDGKDGKFVSGVSMQWDGQDSKLVFNKSGSDLTKYGVNLDQDSFLTRRHFNTPYIKFTGTTQSGKHDAYTIRWSNLDYKGTSYVYYKDGEEGVLESNSPRLIYHHDLLAGGTPSASYFWYYITNSDINANKEEWYRRDDEAFIDIGCIHIPLFYDAWRTDKFYLEWSGSKLTPTFDVSGNRDGHCAGDGRITQLTCRETYLNVYIGCLEFRPAISQNTDFVDGTYNILADGMIAPGVKITVKRGATLVLSGSRVYQDGKIVVEEGGNLIVDYGTVVCPDQMGDMDENGIHPGTIEINNGQVIVLDKGVLMITDCQESGHDSQLNVNQNGTLCVRGGLVMACDSINITSSQLQVSDTGFVLVGYSVKSDVQIDSTLYDTVTGSGKAVDKTKLTITGFDNVGGRLACSGKYELIVSNAENVVVATALGSQTEAENAYFNTSESSKLRDAYYNSNSSSIKKQYYNTLDAAGKKKYSNDYTKVPDNTAKEYMVKQRLYRDSNYIAYELKWAKSIIGSSKQLGFAFSTGRDNNGWSSYYPSTSTVQAIPTLKELCEYCSAVDQGAAWSTVAIEKAITNKSTKPLN